MKFIYKVLIIIFFYSTFIFAAAEEGYFQFDLMGGLGYADSGNSENFPESSFFGKFQGVSRSGGYFRWIGSFAGIMGASSTTAGEFALGLSFYPFSVFYFLPVQPFVGGSGVMISATIDSTSKMLFGYCVNSGIDLRLGRRFGFKVQVDYISTSFNYFRYMGGITLYFGYKR